MIKEPRMELGLCIVSNLWTDIFALFWSRKVKNDSSGSCGACRIKTPQFQEKSLTWDFPFTIPYMLLSTINICSSSPYIFYYFPYICCITYITSPRTKLTMQKEWEWAGLSHTHKQHPSAAHSTYDFPLKSKLKHKIAITNCSNVINEC